MAERDVAVPMGSKGWRIKRSNAESVPTTNVGHPEPAQTVPRATLLKNGNPAASGGSEVIGPKPKMAKWTSLSGNTRTGTTGGGRNIGASEEAGLLANNWQPQSRPSPTSNMPDAGTSKVGGAPGRSAPGSGPGPVASSGHKFTTPKPTSSGPKALTLPTRLVSPNTEGPPPSTAPTPRYGLNPVPPPDDTSGGGASTEAVVASLLGAGALGALAKPAFRSAVGAAKLGVAGVKLAAKAPAGAAKLFGKGFSAGFKKTSGSPIPGSTPTASSSATAAPTPAAGQGSHPYGFTIPKAPGAATPAPAARQGASPYGFSMPKPSSKGGVGTAIPTEQAVAAASEPVAAKHPTEFSTTPDVQAVDVKAVKEAHRVKAPPSHDLHAQLAAAKAENLKLGGKGSRLPEGISTPKPAAGNTDLHAQLAEAHAQNLKLGGKGSILPTSATYASTGDMYAKAGRNVPGSAPQEAPTVDLHAQLAEARAENLKLGGKGSRLPDGIVTPTPSGTPQSHGMIPEASEFGRNHGQGLPTPSAEPRVTTPSGKVVVVRKGGKGTKITSTGRPGSANEAARMAKANVDATGVEKPISPGSRPGSPPNAIATRHEGPPTTILDTNGKPIETYAKGRTASYLGNVEARRELEHEKGSSSISDMLPQGVRESLSKLRESVSNKANEVAAALPTPGEAISKIKNVTKKGKNTLVDKATKIAAALPTPAELKTEVGVGAEDVQTRKQVKAQTAKKERMAGRAQARVSPTLTASGSPEAVAERALRAQKVKQHMESKGYTKVGTPTIDDLQLGNQPPVTKVAPVSVAPVETPTNVPAPKARGGKIGKLGKGIGFAGGILLAANAAQAASDAPAGQGYKAGGKDLLAGLAGFGAAAAATAIPVVGPVIGAGLQAYTMYQGAQSWGSAGKYALEAYRDRGVFRSAAEEKKASEAKYGDKAKATATRNKKRGLL